MVRRGADMALVEVVLVGGPLDGTRFCVDSELTRRFAFSAGPSVIYYEFRRVIFDGQFYMVGVTGQELLASEELGRLIQESRILPCNPPSPPDASPASRPDGWYWVKKEVPNQGELNDWVPALWRGEFN